MCPTKRRRSLLVALVTFSLVAALAGCVTWAGIFAVSASHLPAPRDDLALVVIPVRLDNTYEPRTVVTGIRFVQTGPYSWTTVQETSEIGAQYRSSWTLNLTPAGEAPNQHPLWRRVNVVYVLVAPNAASTVMVSLSHPDFRPVPSPAPSAPAVETTKNGAGVSTASFTLLGIGCSGLDLPALQPGTALVLDRMIVASVSGTGWFPLEWLSWETPSHREAEQVETGLERSSTFQQWRRVSVP